MSTTTGDDIGHPILGDGALVMMIVAGKDDVHPVPLEQGNEVAAHVLITSVIAGRERRAVQVDHGPRRAALRQILLEPLDLFATDPLRVEGHEVDVTPIKRVPALVAGRPAVCGQIEGCAERRASVGPVIVVATRGKRGDARYEG